MFRSNNGSGFLARLKDGIFGTSNSAPKIEPSTLTGESDAALIKMLNNGLIYAAYKDRADADKIAVVAQVCRGTWSRDAFLMARGLSRLLQGLKSLDRDGAQVILGFAASNHSFARALSMPTMARLLEKQPAGTFHDPVLRSLFAQVKDKLRTADTGNLTNFASSEVARRIDATLSPTSQPPTPRNPSAPADAAATPSQSSSVSGTWFSADVPGLGPMLAIAITPEQNLVDFLRTMNKAKPPSKWIEAAAALAQGPQAEAIRAVLIDWLRLLPIPANVAREVTPTRDIHPAMLSEVAAVLVRGAAWLLTQWHDSETVMTLQRSTEALLVKLPAGGQTLNYRSLSAANACILALGTVASTEAVQALGRIKLKLRDERLVKQVAMAMQTAAAQAGMTVADLQEIAAPTFDLDEIGGRTIALGDFTATLRVRTTSDVTVAICRADGKAVKSVPASIKDDAQANAALKALKANAKAIAEALPVHRLRIEQLYLTRRAWPLNTWRERFLDHALVGTLARRLIWRVTTADGTAHALMWHDSILVDAQGASISVGDDDCTVTLWHPLEAPRDEVVAWRAFLMRHKIVQPFKQAHRELYPLTDAERATNIYSNRFAAHILRQHQSVALARLRGWQATMRISADVPNNEPTHIRIADYDLAAEFWTEPAAGSDAEITQSAAYVFIGTDRVCFRSDQADANGKRMLGEPVALDTVPARVFSEVMRDVDLFIGVASIGNDPFWSDGGIEAEHPSQWRRSAARTYWSQHAAAALETAGEARKQFLAELIPSLTIADRCTLDDRYLTVRGKLRSYRIHLGSGNILMDDDRYLCIVPVGDADDASGAFIPFEGDRMLSYVLSKAFMLAADDKITDATILSQLRR